MSQFRDIRELIEDMDRDFDEDGCPACLEVTSCCAISVERRVFVAAMRVAEAARNGDAEGICDAIEEYETAIFAWGQA